MRKIFPAFILLAVLGVSVGLAGLATQDQDDDEQDDAVAVKLEDVPAAARGALAKLAGSATITEVTMEDEDGVNVYEATWKVGNVEHEAEVTEAGDILQLEEVVSRGALPKSVQDVIAKSFGQGAELKIEKRTVFLYEVESEADGSAKEILVSPSGQIVEIEHEEGSDEDRDKDDDDDDDGDNDGDGVRRF